MATGFPVKANYATGDVLTATNMNDLSGTVNYLQYMPPRNPILNSNMSVWQRGTSSSNPTTVAGSYGADRWNFYRANGFATGITMSRQATGDTTNLPNIQYCARIQRTAGNTTADNLYLAQNFESINSIPFAGKTVTLSFYARSGANFSATSNLGIQLVSGTGTDQNIINGFTGSTNVINSTATLTTTWQRFTFTGTVAATATQLAPVIYYTPSGTAGANDYFEITGVQLELGSAANTYMPNQPTYQGELAACQRYFEKSYPQATAPATASTTAGAELFMALVALVGANLRQMTRFKVTKRTSPTVTLYSTSTGATGKWYNEGLTTDVAASAYNIGDIGFQSYQTAGTTNATNVLLWHYTADAEL